MPGMQPVLVVDDTMAYREMVGAILARRGYRVSSAANGREGLDRLRAALEPHVILLDIVMPVLDGIGMLQEIAADRALAAAGHQIIIMSSSPQLNSSQIPATYPRLAKPFTPGQLVAAVEATRAE